MGETETWQLTEARENTNHNSPVTDVTSKDFVCNVGGLASASNTSIATVAAGSKVRAHVPCSWKKTRLI